MTGTTEAGDRPDDSTTTARLDCALAVPDTDDEEPMAAVDPDVLLAHPSADSPPEHTRVHTTERDLGPSSGPPSPTTGISPPSPDDRAPAPAPPAAAASSAPGPPPRH